MSEGRYRALIVDDEAMARRMLTFALQREGFSCDTAGDGEEALLKLGRSSFQLVVTDLRMPHKNGHALAVELLKDADRPVIAVHTSVVEPRLAKDMMIRGVDDIVYKPTDYAAFAAKMKILVARRQHQIRFHGGAAGDTPHAAGEPGSAVAASLPGKLSRADVVSQLSVNTGAMPISQTALDVYRLTLNPDSEAVEIAEAVERDPTLTSEVLRLGNSTHYNPSGKELCDLKDCVLRVGRRRIGELALAANACAAIKGKKSLVGIDADLAWRRSLAAGIAAQLLVDQGRSPQAGHGLVLGAVMHLLGRVLLSNVFTSEYKKLIEVARQSGEALVTLEQETFSATQSEIMSELLTIWKIPAEVAGPLRHVDRQYGSLASLSEAERSRIELVKLAVLIGEVAVGHWEPWDLIELPSIRVIERVGAASLHNVVRATREELLSVGGGAPVGRANKSGQSLPVRRVGYVRAVDRGYDFLAAILPTMGVELSVSGFEAHDHVIINGLDAKVDEIRSVMAAYDRPQTKLFCETCNEERFRRCGETLALPNSMARLDLIRWLDAAAPAEGRPAIAPVLADA